MNRHIENLLLMKMQIAWFFLFCIGAICTASLASLAGNQWNTDDWQTRIMILIGIAGNVANTLMALFSTAMKRVQAGEQPFLDNSSDPTKTTVAATTSVSVQTQKPTS